MLDPLLSISSHGDRLAIHQRAVHFRIQDAVPNPVYICSRPHINARLVGGHIPTASHLTPPFEAPLQEAFTAVAAAIAALLNSAATAEGGQAGHKTVLVASAAALLLGRGLLLVLHGRLALVVVTRLAAWRTVWTWAIASTILRGRRAVAMWLLLVSSWRRLGVPSTAAALVVVLRGHDAGRVATRSG